MQQSWRRDVSEYKRDATYVTVAVLVIFTLVKACEPYFVNTTDKEHTIGKNLLDQANSWYNISIQDENVQSKYQHVSFAAAYLHAARHVLNDTKLERLTGIDVHSLQNEIDNEQKKSNQEIIRQCPKLKPGAKPPKPKRASWM